MNKPKLLRPRFSIRTLAILVTLVCCYAACWGPTKARGVEDVLSRVGQPEVRRVFGGSTVISLPVPGDEIRDVSAQLPLFVRVTYDELTEDVHHHYFWFFG